MQRLVRWFTRVTAYRIALVVGLCFAAMHLWEVARRDEVPLVGKRLEVFPDQAGVGVRVGVRFRHAGGRHNLEETAAAASSPMRRRYSVPISG